VITHFLLEVRSVAPHPAFAALFSPPAAIVDALTIILQRENKNNSLKTRPFELIESGGG
jgi:hypothetical protein